MTWAPEPFVDVRFRCRPVLAGVAGLLCWAGGADRDCPVSDAGPVALCPWQRDQALDNHGLADAHGRFARYGDGQDFCALTGQGHHLCLEQFPAGLAVESGLTGFRIGTQLGLVRAGELNDPADPAAVEVVGCGRAREQIVIVDPVTRRPCGPNEVGEVWVVGPSVARGYWAAPAATEATFGAMPARARNGPFLRSGDRGFIRGGQLFVIGLCHDLVVLGLTVTPV